MHMGIEKSPDSYLKLTDRQIKNAMCNFFLSFLRKQESAVSSGTRWIPAFAGMTES
jgi:hypothetical protein